MWYASGGCRNVSVPIPLPIELNSEVTFARPRLSNRDPFMIQLTSDTIRDEEEVLSREQLKVTLRLGTVTTCLG